jgi:hypothetical protein
VLFKSRHYIFLKKTQSVTDQKKQSRQKHHVREREKTANAARLQKLRAESVQYRDNEKSRRKQDRTDPEYQEVEKCQLRRKRQHDLYYQQAEETRAKNRRLQIQMPVEELICKFHAAVECGPVYVCSSCDQLWYRYSVKKQQVCMQAIYLVFIQHRWVPSVKATQKGYIIHVINT